MEPWPEGPVQGGLQSNCTVCLAPSLSKRTSGRAVPARPGLPISFTSSLLVSASVWSVSALWEAGCAAGMGPWSDHFAPSSAASVAIVQEEDPLSMPGCASPVAQGARPLIAVIDDEPSVRRALMRVLQASNFDAVAFASGEEFLNSLCERMPDCAVLDFQMPGLTGADVLRCLGRSQVALPVIMVTAHDHPALRKQWLADGAVAHLAKPLGREKLVAVIEQTLGR